MKGNINFFCWNLWMLLIEEIAIFKNENYQYDLIASCLNADWYFRFHFLYTWSVDCSFNLLKMNWFSGSIPDAIQRSKQQKRLFIVYIYGKFRLTH